MLIKVNNDYIERSWHDSCFRNAACLALRDAIKETHVAIDVIYIYTFYRKVYNPMCRWRTPYEVQTFLFNGPYEFEFDLPSKADWSWKRGVGWVSAEA